MADEGKDEDLETERVADRICAGFNAKRVPRNQRQELRERLIMFKEKYRKLKSQKGKKLASKKRKRKISTEKEAWTDCFVPCPGCGEELHGWSTGVEPKKKVSVQTSEGQVVIFAGGDLRLPCALCFTVTQCYPKENWQNVTFKPEQLHSELQPRPRQH